MAFSITLLNLLSNDGGYVLDYVLSPTWKNDITQLHFGSVKYLLVDMIRFVICLSFK